jgi:hypothetical protein
MTQDGGATGERDPTGASAPLVAVIMPAYNAASTIAESIASVVAQSYVNWELIVIDDGSTDETAQVVTGLGLEASARLVRQENAGIGVARARGIGLARGELVAFLDSDDVWEPSILEREVAAMVEGGHDVVFSRGYLLGRPTEITEWVPTGPFSGPEMFRLLYEGNRIPVSTVLARTRAIGRAGGSQGTPGLMGEDYDLWLRMANTGSSFFGLPEALLGFRDRPGSHVHNHLGRLTGDLAVLVQFDAQVAAQDPAARRRRMRGLHNRLAAEHAAAGDNAAARRSLASLRVFEPAPLVGAKLLALALLRRRYGALRGRVIG